MDNNISEIGFYATENWTVEDFYNFFHQINILYNRLYVLEKIHEKANKAKKDNKPVRIRKLERAFSSSLSAVEEQDCLTVKSIEIHSPGDFNLLGVDKIIFQLRVFWKDISYRNAQEKEKGIETLRHTNEMNKLKEQAGRQKILSNQIELMERLGYDQEQIDYGIKALGDPLEQLSLISEQRKVSAKSPIDKINLDS